MACESIRSRLRFCDYRFLAGLTLSLRSGNVSCDHPAEGCTDAPPRTMRRARKRDRRNDPPSRTSRRRTSLTFTDLITYVRTRFGVETGQTMAEYGVVLAVITIGAVAVFGLLAGDITSALNAVRSNL